MVKAEELRLGRSSCSSKVRCGRNGVVVEYLELSALVTLRAYMLEFPRIQCITESDLKKLLGACPKLSS